MSEGPIEVGEEGTVHWKEAGKLYYQTQDENLCFCLSGFVQNKKIVWYEKGQAIGYYTYEFDPHLKGNVLGTIFITKLKRKQGFGFLMIKDMLTRFEDKIYIESPWSDDMRYLLRKCNKRLKQEEAKRLRFTTS